MLQQTSSTQLSHLFKCDDFDAQCLVNVRLNDIGVLYLISMAEQNLFWMILGFIAKSNRMLFLRFY